MIQKRMSETCITRSTCRALYAAKMQAAMRRHCVTVSTATDPLTIAPHSMAQGLILAAQQQGFCPPGTLNSYCVAAAKAMSTQTDGWPETERLAFAIKAARGSDSRAGFDT
jgi:imidazolonepropionase-like amidohydrolase